MTQVYLTRVQDSDCADMIAANIASAEYHRAWTIPFTDQKGFDDWLALSHTEACIGLIARHRDNHGIVGVINFTEIVRGKFQSAYTGYCGMVNFARQGLMTQALSTAVAYAFGELGLHRLEANIQPENVRSIALVQRVGFRKEGYSPNYLFIDDAWRGHERWAITREDVEERSRPA